MVVIPHFVIAEQEDTFATWAVHNPPEKLCTDVCHCKISHPSPQRTESFVKSGTLLEHYCAYQGTVFSL